MAGSARVALVTHGLWFHTLRWAIGAVLVILVHFLTVRAGTARGAATDSLRAVMQSV
jgi:hypothetical protein